MIALEPIWIAFLAIASCNVARQIFNQCTGMREDESQSSISTSVSESDGERVLQANTSVRIQPLSKSEVMTDGNLCDRVALQGEMLIRTPPPLHRGIFSSEPPLLSRVRYRSTDKAKLLLPRSLSDGYLEEIYKGGEASNASENLGLASKEKQSLVSSRSCGDLGARDSSPSLFDRLSRASILFLRNHAFGRSDSCTQGEKILTPVASNKTRKVLRSLNTASVNDAAPPGQDGEEVDEELSFYNKSVYSFGQRVLQSYDDMSFVLLPTRSESPSESTLESTVNGDFTKTATTSPPPPPPCMPLRLPAELPASIDVHLTPSWKMERNVGNIPLVPRLRRHESNGSHSPCRIEPHHHPIIARRGKGEDIRSDDSCETGSLRA